MDPTVRLRCMSDASIPILILLVGLVFALRPWLAKVMHGRVAALCSREDQGLADEPFVRCVRHNEVDVVRAVLERCKGFNADLTDEHGNTPLRYAVENGGFEMCKLLLLAGAEVNLRYPDGATPLGIARTRNLEEIAILLRHFGAVEPLDARDARDAMDSMDAMDSVDGGAAQGA